MAAQLADAVAKSRGWGALAEGSRGSVKVLVGRQGSMQGRNGLPMRPLEPVLTAPKAVTMGFRGGPSHRAGGHRAGARGVPAGVAVAVRLVWGRWGGFCGRQRAREFRMQLVMGGVARVKAAGGDGYGGDENNGGDSGGSVDSLCVQPVRGGGGGGGDENASGRSSRHKYGGATGVRGMDVHQQKLALSQAFWAAAAGGGEKAPPPAVAPMCLDDVCISTNVIGSQETVLATPCWEGRGTKAPSTSGR